MQCPECGHEAESTAKFCHECGSRFSSEPASNAASPPAPAFPQDPEPAPAADTPPDESATPAPVVEVSELYAGKLVASASAAFAAGQVGPAETICKQALQFQPDNVAAHLLLSEILEQHGNIEGAAAEKAEALKIEQNEGRKAAGLWGRVTPRTLRGLGALAVGICLAALALSFKNGSPGPETSSGVPGESPVISSRAPSVNAAASGRPGPGFGYPTAAAANVSTDSEALVTGQSAIVPGTSAPQAAPAIVRPSPSGEVQPGPRPAAISSIPAPGYRVTAPPAAASPLTNPMVPPLYPTIIHRIRPGRPTGASASGNGAGSAEKPAIVTMGEDIASTETGTRGDTFAVRLARARTAYESQRYSEAIPAYRAALRQAPSVLDSATTRQELAMAYSAVHSPHEASSEFRAAESEYETLLSGPDAAQAREAIKNIRAQLQLPENRE